MEYKVEDTELTLIADAIRSACNLSDELEFPSDFIAKINTLNSAYVGEDESPYLLRQSPTDFGSNYNSEMPTLIGGSIAWNQRFSNADFSNGTRYWNFGSNATVTVSNGVLTALAKATPAGNQFVGQGNLGLQPNHKILWSVYIASNASSIALLFMKYFPWSRVKTVDIPTTSVLSHKSGVVTIPTDTIVQETLFNFDHKENMSIKCPQLIDLTATFGTEIADYVYGLEQSTAGSGIAWLKSYGFLTKDYYAYNDGSLVSVKTSEHRTTGKNQCVSIQNNSAAAGYDNALLAEIDLFPNTRYSFTFKDAQGHKFYPNENLFVENISEIVATGDRQIVNLTTKSDISESNAAQYNPYIRKWRIFKDHVSNTVVPNFSEVCIGFYTDGQITAYEPYESHSYPLDSDLELRGIPKLSNGSLYYDGDEYRADGNVTRKYGIVDLGTLNYVKRTTGVANRYRFNVNFPSAKPATSATAQANAVCSQYVCMGGSQSYNYDYDKVFAIDGNGVLNIYDSSYNSSTEEQFKTAMSGVYLVYELATPTTETADPFASPQFVDPNGTEEYVDERSVPVPVGHKTEYDYRREVV